MKEIILCKLGEIVLKGANRNQFESMLLRSLRRRSTPYGKFKVSMMQSTVYIEPQDDACDLDGMYSAAKKVFGIVKVSRAAECQKDMKAICDTARAYLPPKMAGIKRFRVDAKRADKTFPYKSPEIAAEVGGVLLASIRGSKVDLHTPEAMVRIEVRDRFAYVHAAQEDGAGGLPIGSAGKGLLLLSGGIDSPVAGFMMAKRGMELEAVYYESPPYTSGLALDKVLTLAQKLCAYCGRINVHVISLTEAQEELMKACEEDYFTLLLRRFMMVLAEKCANFVGAGALITGESLGQVASQTTEALAVTNAALSYIPVFRPCIGMDKEEIVKISRKIDTFDTSILPYEDCCTVFTPRHPKTKPKLENLLAEIAKVDFDALCERAWATRNTVKVTERERGGYDQ